MSRVFVHGVGIDEITANEAEAVVRKALISPRESPLTVFTPNAEIIYRASSDAVLRALINSSELNVPDGIGAVWAARRMGTPLSGRIPGIELGEAALSAAAEKARRVFLLGARHAVAEKAAEKLAGRFTGLIIAGTHHGYFSTEGEENEAVVREILDAKTDLLIVCMGFPRQEEWIMKNRSALAGVGVIMGLGGSIDVWAGEVRRAPAFMRAAGLEWLYRIASDPMRLRRAAALPAFVLMTLWQSRRRPGKWYAK